MTDSRKAWRDGDLRFLYDDVQRAMLADNATRFSRYALEPFALSPDDDTFFGLDRSTTEPVIVSGGALTREMVESVFRTALDAQILRGEALAPPAFLMGDWREPMPEPVEMTLTFTRDPTPDPVQPRPPKRAPRRGPERPVRPPIVWRTK